MPKTYNINALIEELELDQEDITELFTDFKEFLETDLPKLEQAIESNDMIETRSISHSIKGSAGNLRINFIYETAKSMQDSADAKEHDKLKGFLVDLKAHVAEFLEESANV